MNERPLNDKIRGEQKKIVRSAVFLVVSYVLSIFSLSQVQTNILWMFVAPLWGLSTVINAMILPIAFFNLREFKRSSKKLESMQKAQKVDDKHWLKWSS
jgi:hypothetical protein